MSSELIPHTKIRNVYEAANIAAMPDGQVAGDLGYAVNFNTLYRWDGAAWNILTTSYDTVFVPPTYSDGGFLADNGHYLCNLRDGQTDSVYFEFVAPFNMVTLGAAAVILKGLATGNLYLNHSTSYGNGTEVDNLHNANSGYSALGAVVDVPTFRIITAHLAAIEAEDFVGIQVTRDATHIDDTVVGDCQVKGLLLVFTPR